MVINGRRRVHRVVSNSRAAASVRVQRGRANRRRQESRTHYSFFGEVLRRGLARFDSRGSDQRQRRVMSARRETSAAFVPAPRVKDSLVGFAARYAIDASVRASTIDRLGVNLSRVPPVRDRLGAIRLSPIADFDLSVIPRPRMDGFARRAAGHEASASVTPTGPASSTGAGIKVGEVCAFGAALERHIRTLCSIVCPATRQTPPNPWSTLPAAIVRHQRISLARDG